MKEGVYYKDKDEVDKKNERIKMGRDLVKAFVFDNILVQIVQFCELSRTHVITIVNTFSFIGYSLYIDDILFIIDCGDNDYNQGNKSNSNTNR